jgi:hypothetical protein
MPLRHMAFSCYPQQVVQSDTFKSMMACAQPLLHDFHHPDWYADRTQEARVIRDKEVREDLACPDVPFVIGFDGWTVKVGAVLSCFVVHT